ncbi:MAG: AAA family ATPase, partial [Acidimicrobiales bacterium]
MLCELRVTNLGVIEESTVLMGPGLVAVTGETGAGKTMVVGAIELLLGGRADPTMVRQGCAEASVEGRFVDGDREVVLRRVVPLDGRSRAYINGQLATAAALADRGGDLVNLHGQHAHQSLLTAKEQRAALDRF